MAPRTVTFKLSPEADKRIDKTLASVCYTMGMEGEKRCTDAVERRLLKRFVEKLSKEDFPAELTHLTPPEYKDLYEAAKAHEEPSIIGPIGEEKKR